MNRGSYCIDAELG